MRSICIGRWIVALILLSPSVVRAEWNPSEHFGRWIGYGFGDGYHRCPCPATCESSQPPWFALTAQPRDGSPPSASGLPVARQPELPATHATRRRGTWSASALPAVPSPYPLPLDVRSPGRATAINSPAASPSTDAVRSATRPATIRRLPE